MHRFRTLHFSNPLQGRLEKELAYWRVQLQGLPALQAVLWSFHAESCWSRHSHRYVIQRYTKHINPCECILLRSLGLCKVVWFLVCFASFIRKVARCQQTILVLPYCRWMVGRHSNRSKDVRVFRRNNHTTFGHQVSTCINSPQRVSEKNQNLTLQANSMLFFVGKFHTLHWHWEVLFGAMLADSILLTWCLPFRYWGSLYLKSK